MSKNKTKLFLLPLCAWPRRERSAKYFPRYGGATTTPTMPKTRSR